MGFGYLLLGYLVTYVIYITASSLGVGSLTLLAGSAIMFGRFAAFAVLILPLRLQGGSHSLFLS